MLWLSLIAAASAADWVQLQGTETGPEVAIRPWGFVQGLGEAIVRAEPVQGLSAEALAPFEGERASFNRVGAADATWGFALRRARMGLRGSIPKTDQKVAYLMAVEFGDNQVTRLEPVVLTDASITLSYIPGAQVRVGQFKLPLAEEALEMNPLAGEFVNFSSATSQLLLENPSVGGAYIAGASAFRDLGVQVFDSFDLGAGSLGYAAMVSNGRIGTFDVNNDKDVSGRLYWAPMVWGEPAEPIRDELSFFAFWQQGRRDVDGQEVDRIRRGGGVQLERKGVHARAEVIQASGVIELGANPPFPGQPIAVSAEGQAIGGYAFVHYDHGMLGGGLRYDQLWRLTDSPQDLRIFRTVTANAQLELSPRARLLLDYELRFLSAPDGSADAQAIVGTMGDRVSLQVAAIF